MRFPQFSFFSIGRASPVEGRPSALEHRIGDTLQVGCREGNRDRLKPWGRKI